VKHKTTHIHAHNNTLKLLCSYRIKRSIYCICLKWT